MKYIIFIIVLAGLAVIATAGMIVALLVDLKRAKAGEKAIFWKEKRK